MLAWSLCSGKRQPRVAIGRCTAGCGAVSLYAGGATAMAKHAITKTAAGKHNNAGQRTGERGPRWSNHPLVVSLRSSLETTFF
jgi:hypothetical protein